MGTAAADNDEQSLDSGDMPQQSTDIEGYNQLQLQQLLLN